jgi:rhodanese-related sulfurtransferase
MTRGDDPVVLDVRTRAHRRLDGRQIPGAHAVDLDALEHTLAEVPRERDVVVYCACPNEATAAKVALQLRARGFRRVRPLSGGIDAWASAGLALESVAEAQAPVP